MKDIIVVTGHYGCGKTTLCVNLALNSPKPAAVADLDIVNPYFRSADFSDLFGENDVKLFAPDFAGTNLDLPSLGFDIKSVISEYKSVIIDVGGDDAGALALGMFSDELKNRGVEVIYVINQRRFLTKTAEDAVKVMREIEGASRLKTTAIVNNTNLGAQTSASDVENSAEFAREVCGLTGLPLLFTAADERIKGDYFPIKRVVKPVWE